MKLNDKAIDEICKILDEYDDNLQEAHQTHMTRHYVLLEIIASITIILLFCVLIGLVLWLICMLDLHGCAMMMGVGIVRERYTLPISYLFLARVA